MSAIVIPDDFLQGYSDRAFLVGYLVGTLWSLKALVEIDRPEIASIINERLHIIEPMIRKFYEDQPPKTS